MKRLFSTLCGLGLAFAFQASATAQTITNQPQSITINYASAATFTVGASGATNYQWQFNGANLSDVGNITGSTTAVLTLDDVASNQAGIYTVIINNSVTSSNAVLSFAPGTQVTFSFSGFPNGGTSNVTVQLFDHDKPATVENFIHYIRSGAFTNNMFFQRCEPGFVLQGGSYGTTNRTNAVPPITGWTVASQYTFATNQNPPFPAQVDSEFNVGPLIHNHFGTIAMALGPGAPDSATSGFFFNLTDNSSNSYSLDSNTGGFTVFGRILDGTNVLQYFNTLTNASGIVSATTFVDNGVTNNNPPFSTLPVNYIGTNAPANANLVYCDVSFLTTPPVDTTPPTVSITSPAAPVPVTNLQGTAQDDVGLADVICVLTPQPATDGTYPYPYTNASPVTNYAAGTTNWSLSLSPGSYDVSVQSQDGAGNLSTAATNLISVTTIVTNGIGTVTFTNGGNPSFNAVGYPFQDNVSYTVLATPGTNQLFVGWAASQGTNDTPQVTFTMFSGFVLTATFVSNGIPNGIAFTSPAADEILTSGTFNITGTIATNIASPPVTVTCTIFSGGFSVTPPMTTAGTNTWSVTASNIQSGFYVVEATATDSGGNATVIRQNFSVGVPLQLTILGNGTVSPVTNGEYLPVGTNFQVTATPEAGQRFYAWSDGTAIFTNTPESFTMSSNLTLTAEFVSSDVPKVISFVTPTANASINTNTFPLKVRLAPTAKSAQVTCQIFSLSSRNEVVAPVTLTKTGVNLWSVTVSNLPPDAYEVEAVATYVEAGKSISSAISERFYVLAFKQVEGTYTGLFINENGPVAPTNSGFCTLTVIPSGEFSARLIFPAYRPILLINYFSIFGNTATYTLKLPENPVYVSMNLDLTSGSDELTGYVYATNYSWISRLVCYRNVTKLSGATPAKGKYIFSLDPTNWPNTNGYASLSVTAGGALVLSGELPDGATFSQSARISQDGMWPLYVVPAGYGTKGVLMGWESWQTNGSGSFTGQLSWYKQSGLGAYFKAGVVTNVNSTGTNYVPPAPGTYSIVFQGGTISAPVSSTLTVAHSGGQFIPGATTNKLAISLSPYGVLSGHFVTDGKLVQFKGAFFDQSQGGSGFILEGSGQTGYFSLKEQ